MGGSHSRERDALKEALADKVFVVDCMVDRVCTGLSIKPDGLDVQAQLQVSTSRRRR